MKNKREETRQFIEMMLCLVIIIVAAAGILMGCSSADGGNTSTQVTQCTDVTGLDNGDVEDVVNEALEEGVRVDNIDLLSSTSGITIVECGGTLVNSEDNDTTTSVVENNDPTSNVDNSNQNNTGRAEQLRLNIRAGNVAFLELRDDG